MKKLFAFLLILSFSFSSFAQEVEDDEELDNPELTAKVDQAVCIVENQRYEMSGVLKTIVGTEVFLATGFVYARWKASKYQRFWVEDYKKLLTAKYSFYANPEAKKALSLIYQELEITGQTNVFRDAVIDYRPAGPKDDAFLNTLKEKFGYAELKPYYGSNTVSLDKFFSGFATLQNQFDQKFGSITLHTYFELKNALLNKTITPTQLSKLIKLESKAQEILNKLIKTNEFAQNVVALQKTLSYQEVRPFLSNLLSKIEPQANALMEIGTRSLETRSLVDRIGKLSSKEREAFVRSIKWRNGIGYVGASLALVGLIIYVVTYDDLSTPDLTEKDWTKWTGNQLRDFFWENETEVDNFIAAVGDKYPMCNPTPAKGTGSGDSTNIRKDSLVVEQDSIQTN